MALIEVGYVRADAAFVERLQADLRHHALEVTLREWSAANERPQEAEDPEVDFICLVFSRTAAVHERAAVEIGRALEFERGPQGAVVLPLLIESVTLPAELAGRRCAVFTSGYESGLAELLPTFGRIAVITLPDRPELDVTVLSARRGIAKRFASFTLEDGITPVTGTDSHRIRMVAGFTRRGAGIMALIESVGDPAHAPELTEQVGANALKSFTENELKPTNESFSQFFSDADRAAREISTERHLRRSRRLSCKLALALRAHESIYWAAVGPIGVLLRYQQEDETSVVGVLQPKYTYDMNSERDDNEALYCRAPLGYAVDIKLEVQRVPFRAVGDYFAMSSFSLPRQEAESWPLVKRLVRYQEPAQVARALAASHEPLFDDCAVSVMYRVR